MPLSRQLWLAVILITLTSFVGSFAIGMHGVRNFLEQELHRKNADSANSLALSVSQLSKDPVTIGLQLTAYFDSGQYEAISITSPDGNILAERTQEHTDAAVPAWFAALFPLQVEAGHAQVMDGWMQFGVVKVVARTGSAHESLWKQAGTLLLWLVAAAAVGVFIGVGILRRIRQPLAAMVDQADAITDRNFLTLAEPPIPELRRIARAMNDLVRRLHNRAIEETERLAALRSTLQRDAATGLADRDGFMEQLHDAAAPMPAQTGADPEDGGRGTLLVARCDGLRAADGDTGVLLQRVAAHMTDFCGETPGRVAARLGWRDFALLVPDRDDAEALARELAAGLTALQPSAFCRVGATPLRRGAHPDEILADAETALILAGTAAGNTWHALPASAAHVRDWRRSLVEAFEGDRFELALQPVLGPDGALLHREAVPHLRMEPGEWPMANPLVLAARLGLARRIDLRTVRRALAHLESPDAEAEELAVDLSEETAADPEAREALRQLLLENARPAHRLWLAAPESWAAREPGAFSGFRDALRQSGCRVGVARLGHPFDEHARIVALRPDYLKIDADFVRGISVRKACQQSLGELCGQARAAGIAVIAAGVRTAAERRTLIGLGCDGIAGPAVK